MSETKSVSVVESFRKTVTLMEPQIKAALPSQIPSERFIRTLMTTIQMNPAVLECSRESVLSAVMQSAQQGLLADGKEAAIVKYGERAQFLPMVSGIMKKVRNSGEISAWSVQVVKQNDKFELQMGDDEKIVHTPALSDRGKTVGAYSIVTLKDGEKSREFMNIDEIEAIRTRARAKDSGPWKTDYDEMAKKTVIRRHSKRLPMSTDLQNAIQAVDDLYDLEPKQESAPVTVKSSRLSEAVKEKPKQIQELEIAQPGDEEAPI